MRFDAFGLAVYRQNDPTTAFGYEGTANYQSDYDSGLILCGSRYYDPSIGRFYSQDRAKAGTNWYAYCGNDPLTRNDPTGDVTQPNPADIYGTSSEHLNILTDIVQNSPEILDENPWDAAQQIFNKAVSKTKQTLQDANNAFGFLLDFVYRTGASNRQYGPNSTQAQQLEDSSDYSAVLDQIFSGLTQGSVDSGTAFANSLRDFNNSTEWQLGAFNWAFTFDQHHNPNGIDVNNDTTLNSFFYHIPGGVNSINSNFPPIMRGPTWPTEVPSGPYGTIHQTIHLNWP